jgi:hypothetical protein
MKKNLIKFKDNNDKMEIIESKDNYIISKAWNDSNFNFTFKKTKRIPDLSNIILDKEFTSIWDAQNNSWEFIYTVI